MVDRGLIDDSSERGLNKEQQTYCAFN